VKTQLHKIIIIIIIIINFIIIIIIIIIISLRGTEIFSLSMMCSHPTLLLSVASRPYHGAASRICGALPLHFLYVFMQW